MLKIENANVIFNAKTVNEKHALKNFSLDMKKGDFVTVIGSNGAGKSTLMNAVSGSVMLSSGKIFLDGTDITRFKEHKRAKFIGRLFQDPLRGTAPNMTIEENLGLAFSRGKKRTLSIGISRSDLSMFREKLEALGLGLEDRMKTPVGLLSGGQRQAVTLLMATLQKPQLLLLDEHTAALDPATSAKVLALSDKIIHENGLTALMVTHNMQDAITYGNRLIMMDKGRIILDISGEEKKHLTIEDLLHKFEEVSGSKFASDSVILG